MVEVILIEPENPGNIGSIARAMKNFGLKDLTLINPRCSHANIDAMRMAKHAKDILENAVIKPQDYLKKAPLMVATTARLGNDYNLPRTPITPAQLAERVSLKDNISLVFGRESSGLKNEEIAMADLIVHIPAGKKYISLNVAQAAGIVFYELFQASGRIKSSSHYPGATRRHLKVIAGYFDEVLDKLQFPTVQKRETQRILWKRIMARSFLTRRESFGVMGFLKKMLGRR